MGRGVKRKKLGDRRYVRSVSRVVIPKECTPPLSTSLVLLSDSHAPLRMTE